MYSFVYIHVNKYKKSGVSTMGFWTAIAVIVIVFLGTEFVIRIIKMDTRHKENMERIKRGYPTLDGSVPLDYEHKHESKPEPDTSRLQ